MRPGTQAGEGRHSLRKGWRLLTRRERRTAIIVLVFFLLTSVSAAVGVASIYPFLAVLSDPGLVETNAMVRWISAFLGDPTHIELSTYFGAAAIVIIFLSSAIQTTQVYLVERFSQMRVHAFSSRLLAVYTAQPLVFFLGRNTSDMEKSILNESRELVRQFYRPAAEICAAVLGTISVLVILMVIAPMITLSALGFLSASYLIIYLVTNRLMRAMGQERIKAASDRHRFSNEALTGIRDVKITGSEDYFLRRYEGASYINALTLARAGIINIAPRYFIEAVVFCGVVLICLVFVGEADGTSGGGLAALLPELGLLAMGARRLLPELQKLYQSASLIRLGVAVVENVHADLTLPVDRASRSGRPEAIRLNEQIVLQNLSFDYPGAERRALHDIDVTIRKGERIGVVGPTGSGKSTLADILLGLLTPTAGAILVDGREIGPGNIRGWQRSIGFVQQDIFLFDSTVAENIAFGEHPDAISRDRVEKAAKVAQLHDFITGSLPSGYDTVVGERGVRLSGGQRQRIGIARALYRDTDLIVFDEATSALDSATESDLMEAIEALPGNRTVVLIAHRLTTVRSCDRILVLSDGHLVASGDWESNLHESKEFQRLAAHFS